MDKFNLGYAAGGRGGESSAAEILMSSSHRFLDLEEWSRFILSQAHILRQRPALLFQKAANQPDNTDPARKAADRFRGERESRPWLRWVNKPRTRGRCLITFVGHNGVVAACAFSRDGTRVVSASWDETLKVWESATGVEVATMRGHTHRVMACAFSPDGTRVVSGAKDGTVKLWDAETGFQVGALDGHKYGVSVCAFSPDGAFILTGARDGDAYVWDAATLMPVCRTQGSGPGEVTAGAFSPDGTRWACGSEDGLSLWDTATGRELGSTYSIIHIRVCAFSPDASEVVVLSETGRTERWNASTGRTVTSPSGPGGKALALSPDGTLTVGGWEDGTVCCWETANGEEVARLRGHLEAVMACAFSPDGSHILSASWDGTLKLWDTPPKQVLADQPAASIDVGTCAFSPDGTRIVSASTDEGLVLLDTTRDSTPALRLDHAGDVLACAFSPDGTRVVSVSHDHTLTWWDAATGAELASQHGGASTESEWVFIVGDDRLVWLSHDVALKVSDVATSAEAAMAAGQDDQATVWALSPDCSFAVSGMDDWLTLKAWDTSSGAAVATFSGHGSPVRFCHVSPDSRYVVCGCEDGELRLMHAATGAWMSARGGYGSQPTYFPSEDGADILTGWERQFPIVLGEAELRISVESYSPDASVVACRWEDGSLELLGLPGGDTIASIKNQGLSGVHAAFSPDGAHLCSAGFLALIVSEVATGREVIYLPHEYPVSSVRWSPDGSRLLCDFGPDGVGIFAVENVVSGRPIVTAYRRTSPTRDASPVLFGCPCCRTSSEIPASALGGHVSCPACRTVVQLNPFTADPRWRSVPGA